MAYVRKYQTVNEKQITNNWCGWVWLQPMGWTRKHKNLGEINTHTLSFWFWIHQVNSALYLDRPNKQWVDLGNYNEACMAQSETCGTAGGAISMWLKIIDCHPDYCGIISTFDGETGFHIFLLTGLRYVVFSSVYTLLNL